MIDAPTILKTAGQRAAIVHYHGGDEGLAGAWPKLDAWIAAQGRTAAASLWETYLVDPSASPDPAAWQTELCRPLLVP